MIGSCSCSFLVCIASMRTAVRFELVSLLAYLPSGLYRHQRIQLLSSIVAKLRKGKVIKIIDPESQIFVMDSPLIYSSIKFNDFQIWSVESM